MKKFIKLSLAAAAAVVQVGSISGYSNTNFSPYVNDMQVAEKRKAK